MNRIVALLALALAGCIGRQPTPVTPARHLPWVALARPTGGNATTAALVAAISEHNAIREAPVKAPQPLESDAAAIRWQLKQARQDYFTAYVDRARQGLKQALRRAHDTYAVGLEPRELAEIHLYLAAVSHATAQSQQAQWHLDAAIRFLPALELDQSLFSPQLREALERRRGERRTAELRIRTTPSSATVLWDGKEVGRAPVTLARQGTGEHFLVVHHPLFQVRRERIVVTTAAQLELKLEPASPGEIVAALRQHPELAATGLELLGVNAALWVEPSETGAVARSLSRAGSREIQVPQGTASRELTRIVRSLSAEAPPPPKKKRERTAGWGRYWWAWAAAGVVVVGAAVALPLALQGGSEPSGRPVVMEIPLLHPAR